MSQNTEMQPLVSTIFQTFLNPLGINENVNNVSLFTFRYAH